MAKVPPLAARINDTTSFLKRLASYSNKEKRPTVKRGEPISEREFVRFFGDKVKKVRYSQRADFVGLTVLGKFQGFIITADGEVNGEATGRKVRLIDIDEAGKAHVTHRSIPLKKHDSASFLRKGLLKYVR